MQNVRWNQYLNCKILHGETLLQPLLNLSEDQARSHDFQKGDFFGSLIQSRTKLTQIFVSLKVDWGDFSAKIIGDLQKKKGLRQN